MEKETVFAKLVGKEKDLEGYTTYVFVLLDPEDIQRLNTKYIMCVRYPKWDHYDVKIDDIGYLQVLEVKAGIDKYYVNNNFKAYNYDACQFIKFIQKQSEVDKVIHLDLTIYL